MFTGIIRALGTVLKVIKTEDLLQFAVEFPHNKLEIGASVSIDGVCQTVTKIDENLVWFDAIDETLKRTTFDTMEVGQTVNIEQSAKIGDEIGGHLLSGHIYGVATISKIEKNAYFFQCPKQWMQYFFTKGFVAIDGASLTIVDVDREKGLFSVHLIPETLKRTVLGQKKAGVCVNIEIDSMTQAAVETVKRLCRPT